MSITDAYIPAVAEVNQEGMSGTGKWAMVLAALFVFSISAEYRLQLGGFLIHPYLIVLPFGVLLTRFKIFDLERAVLSPLLLFFVIFSLGSLQNDNPLEEIIKVGAAILTFLFFATSVKSEKDFRMISLGFVLCAVVIGYLGFGKGEAPEGSRLAGINVLEGIGNKNAQSLFTLPGIFLTVLLIIKSIKRRKLVMLVTLTISLFFIVVGVFLSANRSGWVGLLIIAFAYLIYLKFKPATLVVFSILFLFSYLGISKYASDIVEHKYNKTVEGYSSDEGRKILIRESLRVGLENPLLGVGADELHKRMNVAVLRSPSFQKGTTDTHFLIGYIFGGTGIFALLAFLFFLYRVTGKKLTKTHKIFEDTSSLRTLLISFVILFFVRSFFTREILYSPTFIGCLGLLYSYYEYRRRQVMVLFMQLRNENVQAQ